MARTVILVLSIQKPHGPLRQRSGVGTIRPRRGFISQCVGVAQVKTALHDGRCRPYRCDEPSCSAVLTVTIGMPGQFPTRNLSGSQPSRRSPRVIRSPCHRHGPPYLGGLLEFRHGGQGQRRRATVADHEPGHSCPQRRLDVVKPHRYFLAVLACQGRPTAADTGHPLWGCAGLRSTGVRSRMGGILRGRGHRRGRYDSLGNRWDRS